MPYTKIHHNSAKTRQRQFTKKSRQAKFNRSVSYVSDHAKNIVLTIISTTALIVIGFMIFNLIATPEFLVKREVESITKDYYENYFYPSILSNNSISADSVSTPEGAASALSDVLAQYTEKGFARLTLHQLLLYDNLRHYSSIASLSKYCDLDRTLIKIYPESPFTHQNYRVNYTYSCKFQ